MKKPSPRLVMPTRRKLIKKVHQADHAVVEAIFAAARDDLVAFVQVCFFILSPNTPLMMNWHIKSIVYQLEQVRLGHRKRLIVSMPPRHLKSIIASVAFPAFLLGHDPTKCIIVASYAADLAIKHGNDFRTIIESAIYKKIFPNVRIAKNTESEVTTTAGGFRIATSVDGPVTGRGCDVAIIDDPAKPSEAWSDPRRERVNTWFFQTLLSRLNDPRSASMILVMQRLHMNDLAGTLLNSSDEWFYLKLSAITAADETVITGPHTTYRRPAGTALHEERMSLDDLQKIREQVGSDTWQAQYQQDPVPPGGYMIKRHWVQRYDELPMRKPGSMIIQSVDTAIKAGPQNDYSVISTLLIQDHCYWLIEVARKRLEYPALKAFVVGSAEKHKPTKILIEDAGTGSALIQELRHTSFSTVAVKPQNDKITRMLIAAAKFESKKVFLPRSAPWLAELETELFSFPQSRHDDQIDSISQALNETVASYDIGALADGLSRAFFRRPNWPIIY